MSTSGSKPVLWIGLTDNARTANEQTLEEHLEHVRQTVQEAVGDEYIVVCADDKTRLLDAERVEELLQTEAIL